MSFLNFEDCYDPNHLINIHNHQKVAAAQLAQKISLHQGTELYCKQEYGDMFPDLKRLLYRQPDLLSDITLEKYRIQFIEILEGYIQTGSLNLTDQEPSWYQINSI